MPKKFKEQKVHICILWCKGDVQLCVVCLLLLLDSVRLGNDSTVF